jgi:peroxiredoxin/mono/diheme cytochrome c family protein
VAGADSPGFLTVRRSPPIASHHRGARPMRFDCLAKHVPNALALLAFAALALSPFAPRAQGDTPPRTTLRDLKGPDGRTVRLAAPEGGATALVFYSSECPISNSYSPTLNALVREFPRSSLTMVGVCVDPDLTDEQVQAHAREFGLKFPVVRDRKGALAAQLGAKVTPEAFVVDAKGAVRYHGRIDDQYAARRQRNAHSESHELRDAVAAVLAGRDVRQAHVAAVGCPLPEPPKASPVPTYSKDVVRILQKNCQECHRPGQVGPFPLMTFEQAQKRADDLAGVAEDRRMPPWKPAPGFGLRFKHDKSISEADITTLAAWAEGGAPEGDKADLPAPAKFNDDWTLGTPDLVLQPAEDFAIPADGEDIYRCFVIPTDLPKDMYISAIEYKPGNRKVVHHVICYVDTSGEARKRDEGDPGQGYSCFSGPAVEIHGDLGGWAPGNEPNFLPEGIGRSLPKKSDVIMQVHYHPSGRPETDRTRIGLHVSRKPVKQILHWSAAANLKMELPPGQSNVEIKARWTVPVDMEAYAVTPHMHLLGRDMTMSITYPDGRTVDLVKIDDWDFNWQLTYYFEKPLDVPKDSVLNVVAHYDNSEANPRNPNHPPKLVKWGEATTDEMCIGFLGVTKKGQDLTRPGEKDDLHDILIEQREEGKRKYKEAREKAEKEKAEKPKSD